MWLAGVTTANAAPPGTGGRCHQQTAGPLPTKARGPPRTLFNTVLQAQTEAVGCARRVLGETTRM